MSGRGFHTTHTRAKGVTFGGSGGMAGGRGKTIKPKRVGTKSGLRSNVSKVANTEGTEGGAVGGAPVRLDFGDAGEFEDADWNTEGSGEEDKGFEVLGTKPKQRQVHRKAWTTEPPELTAGPGESTMVEMFRDFLIPYLLNLKGCSRIWQLKS